MSSPLQEAQTTSLNELFSRDPELYQRQDLDEIIARLREQRAKWKADADASPDGAKRRGAPKAPKAPVTTKETASVQDLLDLL